MKTRYSNALGCLALTSLFAVCIIAIAIQQIGIALWDLIMVPFEK